MFESLIGKEVKVESQRLKGFDLTNVSSNVLKQLTVFSCNVNLLYSLIILIEFQSVQGLSYQYFN